MISNELKYLFHSGNVSVRVESFIILEHANTLITPSLIRDVNFYISSDCDSSNKHQFCHIILIQNFIYIYILEN